MFIDFYNGQSEHKMDDLGVPPWIGNLHFRAVNCSIILPQTWWAISPKKRQIGDIMLEIVFVVGGWCGCKCWFTLPGAIDSSALGSGSGVNMVGRVSLQTLCLSCALQHTSPILEQHQNLHQHLHQNLNQIGKPVSYEHQIGHIWRGRFFRAGRGPQSWTRLPLVQSIAALAPDAPWGVDLPMETVSLWG